MASRWEKPVLAQVVEHLDPAALCGKTVRSAGLDPRLFDGRPEAHSEPAFSEIRDLYESLRQAACAAGRLGKGVV